MDTETPTDSSMDTETPTEPSMDTETPTDSSMDTETPTDSPMDTETPTDSPMDTETPTDSQMGGSTTTITVGPGGNFSFDPSSVTITAGDTVEWVWDSASHNVVPDSIPADSSWEGDSALSGAGHTYSYTFEVPGDYSYYCEPHRSFGMTGSITVESA